MVGESNGETFKSGPGPPNRTHLYFAWGAGKGRSRCGAEGDNDLWLDELELFAKVGKAEGNLLWTGWTVAVLLASLGAPIDDVGNVDLITAEIHGLNHFGKELASWSNEGNSGFLLLCSGSLAAEEDL